MHSALDGYWFDTPTDDLLWNFHERMRRDMAAFDHLLDQPYEARKAMIAHEREQRGEDAVVEALLRRAQGTVELRGEAERLVENHHLAAILPAMRSLARARDVDLETVLRAMLRGELRSIVELPESQEERWPSTPVL